MACPLDVEMPTRVTSHHAARVVAGYAHASALQRLVIGSPEAIGREFPLRAERAGRFPFGQTAYGSAGHVYRD
jgi:hypothetical protein